MFERPAAVGTNEGVPRCSELFEVRRTKHIAATEKKTSQDLNASSTGVTVFLEGRNSRRLIPLRTLFSGCLLGGVFSEPGDF